MVKTHLHFLILAGFIAIAPEAWVQTKKPFKNLEAEAFTNGRNLAEQYQKKVEADRRLSTAKWENLPQFSATYRNITNGVFLADDFLNTRTSLSLRLSQDLIELFKIRPAKIKEARAKLQLEQIRLKLARNYILYEFRNAYVNALILKKEVQLFGKLEKIYSKILKIKLEQYNYSEALLPDVLKIESQQLKYKSQLNYSANRFESAKSELAEFLNIHEELILWDEPALNHPELALDYLLPLARKSDLQFFSQKYLSVATAAQKNRAAYESLDFDLYAGLRYRGKNWAPTSASPEVGVRLSFPLFYPWLRSAKKAALKARGKAYSEASLTSQSRIQAEVKSLVDELNYLKSQQRIARKQVELRKEIVRIETSKVRDKPNNENIFKLEAELAEARLKTEVAKYDHLQVYYKLLYMCGINSTQEILKAKEHFGSNFNQALWVWKTEKIVFNKGKSAELIKFCAWNKITQIYFSLNKKVLNHENFAQAMVKFISQLHEHNIKISALIGDPNWIFPENQTAMQLKIKAIAEYDQQAARNAKFDAIHFDIEPQALESWSSENKPGLMNALTASLIAAKSMMNEYQIVMPIECAIPYFFFKIDSLALEEMIPISDEIIIMAYQTTNPNKQKSAVLPILRFCKKYKKKVTIGIDPSDFSDKGELHLLSRTLRQELENLPNFKGIAFHDYEHYRRLSGN